MHKVLAPAPRNLVGTVRTALSDGADAICAAIRRIPPLFVTSLAAPAVILLFSGLCFLTAGQLSDSAAKALVTEAQSAVVLDEIQRVHTLANRMGGLLFLASFAVLALNLLCIRRPIERLAQAIAHATRNREVAEVWGGRRHDAIGRIAWDVGRLIAHRSRARADLAAKDHMQSVEQGLSAAARQNELLSRGLTASLYDARVMAEQLKSAAGELIGQVEEQRASPPITDQLNAHLNALHESVGKLDRLVDRERHNIDRASENTDWTGEDIVAHITAHNSQSTAAVIAALNDNSDDRTDLSQISGKLDAMQAAIDKLGGSQCNHDQEFRALVSRLHTIANHAVKAAQFKPAAHEHAPADRPPTPSARRFGPPTQAYGDTRPVDRIMRSIAQLEARKDVE